MRVSMVRGRTGASVRWVEMPGAVSTPPAVESCRFGEADPGRADPSILTWKDLFVIANKDGKLTAV